MSLVAPLVGAWIETLTQVQKAYPQMSLPSWERGLKQSKYAHIHKCIWSLPSWERGLKL